MQNLASKLTFESKKELFRLKSPPKVIFSDSILFVKPDIVERPETETSGERVAQKDEFEIRQH